MKYLFKYILLPFKYLGRLIQFSFVMVYFHIAYFFYVLWHVKLDWCAFKFYHHGSYCYYSDPVNIEYEEYYNTLKRWWTDRYYYY